MSSVNLSKRFGHSLGSKLIFLLMAMLLALSTALIGVMPVSADFIPPDANSNTISLDLSRPMNPPDNYYDGDTIHYFVTVGVDNVHGTGNNTVRPAMETNVTTRFMPPGSATWTVLDTGVTLNRGDEISYNATYKVLSHNTTFVSATPLANPILDYVINHADEHDGIVTAHGNVTAVSHSSTDNDTAHNDRDIDTDVTHIPNTNVSITASALYVLSGGSVNFNVTEANPSGSGAVSLTSPRVELTGGLIQTLTKGSSGWAGGDSNDDGILDPGETWIWNPINSGSLTSTTQFNATGHGYFGVTDITYPTYEGEWDNVTVNVYTPSTGVTLTAIPAGPVTVNSIVALRVTETNNGTGAAPLTAPYVYLSSSPGGAPLPLILNHGSGYLVSSGNGDLVLDVGETWTWNVTGVVVAATTTYNATGHGTAPNDVDITFDNGYTGERAYVRVTVIHPNTTVTITPSAYVVLKGGTVTLTVTENNTGDDPLHNVLVAVFGGWSGILAWNDTYFVDSSDDGNEILDVGEVWRWEGITSVALMSSTTFIAQGYGLDSLNNLVTFDAVKYPNEKKSVDVLIPSTVMTLGASITDLPAGGGWVTLTITDHNNGDVALNNTYVILTNNLDATTYTLDKTPPPSGYYISGDVGDDNIMGIASGGETWTWQITLWVTEATTFYADGHGFANGLDVSAANGYPSEHRDISLTSKPHLRIFKFNDLNNNGVQDRGEEGLAGWHYVVTRLGQPVAEGDTGTDGWLIIPIDPGTYLVTEISQEGWTSTTPTAVMAIVPADGSATVVFGNHHERVEVPPVPAIGQWGMIAMAILFTGLMVWVIRRRQIISLPKAK